MQLTYRGVRYDYTPPAVQSQESGVAGSYRGVDIRFRTIKKAPVQPATVDLIYRGVPYRSGEAAVTAAPSAVPATAAIAAVAVQADKARLTMMKHHRAVKLRQQSMLGRLAAEVGLPEGASQYWNHVQGKVHPSFWATYDRSGASFS